MKKAYLELVEVDKTFEIKSASNNIRFKLDIAATNHEALSYLNAINYCHQYLQIDK